VYGHYVAGSPGVGKTHLAISLAIAAAQRGRRVYYGTLIDLITSLEEAQAAGQLSRRLSVLTHPSLLVVDEIGYLPINHTGAVLFFQLMNGRYEHASTVLTSNLLCGGPHKWINAVSIVMQVSILCAIAFCSHFH